MKLLVDLQLLSLQLNFWIFRCFTLKIGRTVWLIFCILRKFLWSYLILQSLLILVCSPKQIQLIIRIINLIFNRITLICRSILMIYFFTKSKFLECPLNTLFNFIKNISFHYEIILISLFFITRLFRTWRTFHIFNSSKNL